MRQLFSSILLLFFISFLPASGTIAQESFAYENQKFGIQLLSADGWKIGYNRETVPELFKNSYPENRNINESPLFIGQYGNSAIFVRYLIEAIDMDPEDYFRVFEAAIQKEGMSFVEASINRKTGTMVWKYDVKKNGFPFRFVDYVTFHQGHFMRFSFWTLTTLFPKYESEFQKLTQKLFFRDNEENMIFPWIGYESELVSLEPSLISPEAGESKSNETSNELASVPGATFYKLNGPAGNIYILGTIHVGKPEFYPFPPEIETAFQESENLVLEADVRKIQSPDMLEKIRPLTVLEGDQTLDQVISPGLYEKVESIITGYGLSMDSYRKIKPWVMAINLSAFITAQEGYLSEEGVERYFLAKSENKIIIELEGAFPQLEFFNQLDGESFLAYSVLNNKTAGYRLNKSIQAWRAGDTDQLVASTSFQFQDENSPEAKMQKLLLDDRNLLMTDKIESFIKGEGNYFVMVGAAHLGGKSGIIKLLEDRGYRPIQFIGKKQDSEKPDDSSNREESPVAMIQSN